MDPRVLEIRPSDFKTLAKCAIRPSNAPSFVEHDHRRARRIDNCIGKLENILQIREATFHLVDFDQGDNRSVYPIIKRPVRSNTELVPVVFRIAHLSFAHTQALNDFMDQGHEIRDVQIGLDI